jgi:hypothetical protein
MTPPEVAWVTTTIGVVLTALFSIIIAYLRDIRKKMVELCHELYCHRHTLEGEVYVPSNRHK